MCFKSVCVLFVCCYFLKYSVYLRWLLSLPDDSGTNSRLKSESPFFLLGKVVMQQSYVSALIAMMVTIRLNLCYIFWMIYTFIFIHFKIFQHLIKIFESFLFLMVVSILFRSGASHTTAGWHLCCCSGLVLSGSCVPGTINIHIAYKESG